MLNGKLVSLRELEIHDLDLLFLWDEKEDLYLFKGRYRFASQEDLKNNFTGYSFSQKIFVINRDQAPIGLASYWDEDTRSRTCEIYAKIYDKSVDPHPYLTESLSILINFLFNTENLSRIYTCISDPFDEIKQVLGKLGFIKEGALRDHRFIQGRYVDTVVYGQLKGENGHLKTEKLRR
ncbi:MAG: GNAT family N-acetyltransferase [Proteobacteria bacterium]|nr:GNAT family N-acetyltransferase [Pseudomonadota bacterium]MBU1585699.1 GNAT family N-acetyltransferase [Pseudomonadota bacterium]MBU2629208.1 GNAT family N-acetyltransferase [Pseudomonadota bacterium]